ncbi:MAG: hypothetical protein HY348_16385 [Nitrospira defluvii]|nr:hypothetical protein [Nitrospira defluvii]
MPESKVAQPFMVGLSRGLYRFFRPRQERPPFGLAFSAFRDDSLFPWPWRWLRQRQAVAAG